MGVYSKYILPRAVNFACSLKPNMRQREKVVPLASGEVLEVGVGSELNFPFSDPSRVTKLRLLSIIGNRVASLMAARVGGHQWERD